MCGRSFSGKSTVAAILVRAFAAEAVSLDAINAERGLWGGDGITIAEWSRTYELARERAAAALDAGAVVIVDDTSSPRFLRDGWRQLAREHDRPMVLVHLDVSVETSLARQAANRRDPRRGDLTDDVMREHLDSFEPPTSDENAIRVTADSDPDALIAALRQALLVTPPP